MWPLRGVCRSAKRRNALEKLRTADRERTSVAMQYGTLRHFLSNSKFAVPISKTLQKYYCYNRYISGIDILRVLQPTVITFKNKFTCTTTFQFSANPSIISIQLGFCLFLKLVSSDGSDSTSLPLPLTTSPSTSNVFRFAELSWTSSSDFLADFIALQCRYSRLYPTLTLELEPVYPDVLAAFPPRPGAFVGAEGNQRREPVVGSLEK